MGLRAILRSFTRVTRNDVKVTDVKCAPGGNADITVEHFSDSGDDAHPLPDDYLFVVEAPGTGRWVAVGYIDTVNDPKATPGEKRMYSRNIDGQPVTEIWLKSDGTIAIYGDGDIELNGNTDFAVRFNELESYVSTLSTELESMVTVFNGHTQPVSGSPPVAAVPSTPMVNPTASVSAAKVDNVRLP